MNVAVAGVLLLAGLGLLLVRTASVAARWVAWCVVLVFAVVAIDAHLVGYERVEARTALAALTSRGNTGQRTQALAAAAVAGPRALDLTLTWLLPLDEGVGGGPLGAVPRVPMAPLPLEPGALQVRAFGTGAAGRPLLLQVEAPALPAPLEGLLTVHFGEREVLHARVALGSTPPAECTFTPASAGAYRLELEVDVGQHRVTCRGDLTVATAPRVLVLEPSGIAAAALRAQGVAVDEATSLPADWRTAQALVVGRALPVAEQQAIVAMVLDGMGLFVLAPGFGAVEEPLRAILPVRPLPPDPGEGGTGQGGPPRLDPLAQPPPPPPNDEPPRGDARGALPVAKDPIEVDKHSIAMVLVVDRSFSMGNTLANGQTKMSYAKTSALRTAQALGEGDQVAIVTFGNKDGGRTELPLTAATSTAAVRGGIERLAHAAENTFLLGGLRVAHELMLPSRAAVKHIVVITDGEFDVSESVALRALANRMRTENKITLSVISIVDKGTDSQFRKVAEELTKDGGGQFFQVADVTSVPAFVVAEVTRALQRVGREPRDRRGTSETPPVQPPPTAPRIDAPESTPSPPKDTPTRVVVRAVADSPLLAPHPASAWPTLGAAVAGTAPVDAQVLLVAGDTGWPLLCYGNRGLGRVGAFAADLCGNAGDEFRAADAFPARLALWIQSVLPAARLRAPATLLRESAVAPMAPTPRDVSLLTRLAGAPPAPHDAPVAVPPPALERTVVSLAPDWACWAVLALLALAVCERWLGLAALRRGTF